MSARRASSSKYKSLLQDDYMIITYNAVNSHQMRRISFQQEMRLSQQGLPEPAGPLHLKSPKESEVTLGTPHQHA